MLAVCLDSAQGGALPHQRKLYTSTQLGHLLFYVCRILVNVDFKFGFINK